MEKKEVEDLGFSIGEGAIKLLGHEIMMSGDITYENMWAPAIKKISGIIFKAHSLNLAPLEKANLTKTFILGNLAFTARVIPITSLAAETITSQIINFINCGFFFSRTLIFQAQRDGGLGIPNIKYFCDAILTKNLSRYLKSRQIWSTVLCRKFNFGKFDRGFTNLSISSSLTSSAEVLSDFGLNYYSIRPCRAPLFFSPACREWSKRMGWGGIPPLSSDNTTHLRCKFLTISDLGKNIDPAGICNLLGYNPVPLSSYRLLCGSRSIQACLSGKDMSPHPCAITFLSSTKGSKSLRNLQNVVGPREKNPFERYLARKTNLEEFFLAHFFNISTRAIFR